MSEREDFEAAMRESLLPDSYDLTRTPAGCYSKTLIEMAWQGWSRRAQAVQAGWRPEKQITALMLAIVQYAQDCASHTGESTGNLDLAIGRIEGGLRELAGLAKVQPDLLPLPAAPSQQETP